MTHQKLDEKEPGSVLKLKKWYMIPEGPDFKEGFAFTDPCSTPNEREVELVMKTSYDKLQSELAELKWKLHFGNCPNCEPIMCCSGRDCGCRAMPVNFVYSDNCGDDCGIRNHSKIDEELRSAREVISYYAIHDFGGSDDFEMEISKRAREFMKKYSEGK